MFLLYRSLFSNLLCCIIYSVRDKIQPKETAMEKVCAIFKGPEKAFETRSYQVSAPQDGTAGLKLITSGICGTDVHIYEGRLGMPDMPLVIGHEFIGEIDALGSGEAVDALGKNLHIRDKAIACVAIACGKCINCLAGETASCLAFQVTYVKSADDAPHFHGGFSEYLYSPFSNLVKLPDDVDPMAAAAFPCGGPTVIRSCAYGGGLKSGELVVIQGNGSLGLFAAAYAKAHGCKVIIIGSSSNPERRQLTMELQPDHFLDFRKKSEEEIRNFILAEAAALGRGDGADVVIETSGAAEAFPFGLSLLRTRGRYFVPGQYSDRGQVSIPPHLITFKALQIFGSGQYTMADIATYLDFLAAHPELQVIFKKLLRCFPVKKVNSAIEAAKSGNAVKAVFRAE